MPWTGKTPHGLKTLAEARAEYAAAVLRAAYEKGAAEAWEGKAKNLEAENAELRAELEAARQLVFQVGDRLLMCAQALGRVAERKDKRSK